METVCQAACAFPFWEAVSMPVDISFQVGKYLIKSMILFERSGKGLRNWISLGWTREVGSSTHSQLGEGEILEFFKFFVFKASFALWNISKSLPIVVKLHLGFRITSFLNLKVKLCIFNFDSE